MKCLNGLMQCKPCIALQCTLAYLGNGMRSEQWLTALTLMYPFVSSPLATSGDNEKLWRHEQHHKRKEVEANHQATHHQVHCLES